MNRKILLADDHVLFGDLLETYLITQGYECIRAFDYSELQSFAKEKADCDLDIVLLDVMMPGYKSLSTLANIVKAFEDIPVVALTSVPSIDLAKESIDAGLSGYLQKTMALRKIPIVLEFILSGEVFVEGIGQHKGSEKNASDLSAIEKRVLAMIAQGMSNKEIALEMDITETGVKSINRTLSRKFNVKNRTQLALKVVKEPQIIGIEGAYFSKN